MVRVSKLVGLRGCRLTACLFRRAIRESPEIWQPSFERASKPIPETVSAARYFVGKSVSAALLFSSCFSDVDCVLRMLRFVCVDWNRRNQLLVNCGDSGGASGSKEGEFPVGCVVFSSVENKAEAVEDGVLLQLVNRTCSPE